MRIVSVCGMVCLVLLAGAMVTADAQTSGGSISFVITESKSTVEKVESVDHAMRKVTLKDETGAVRSLKVGNDIQNFSKVKVGDTVTIETFQNISVEVKSGPGEPMNISSEGQTAPLPGEKPTGVRTIEGMLKTRIEAIDYDKRTITFKGRDNTMKTYRIGPELKRFSEIRRGDMLSAEYSQTIKMVVK